MEHDLKETNCQCNEENEEGKFELIKIIVSGILFL